MRTVIGKYVLINNGYNNKVYCNGTLVKEFTDTNVNAIAYIKKMK